MNTLIMNNYLALTRKKGGGINANRRCFKKYPEMVAEMLPHFDGNEILEFGKDNLWFL